MTEIKEKKPRKSREKVKVVSRQEIPLPESIDDYDGQELLRIAKNRVAEDVKRFGEVSAMFYNKDREEQMAKIISEAIRKEKQIIHGKE